MNDPGAVRAPTSIPPTRDPVTGEHSIPAPAMLLRRAPPPARPGGGVRRGRFTSTIEEGERVLVTGADGRGDLVMGPRRVWTWGKRVRPLTRHVAHPGEYLIVRNRNGAQKHVPGPAELWLDPRETLSIQTEEALRLDAREAIVVYARIEHGGARRRIVHGPAAFVPEPGEWLHSFSWHAPRFQDGRHVKVPHGLEFQKLWMLPDQMYHDIPDVRTSDGALLTVRLLVVFELVDVEKMLGATQDPIADLVNAASADVVHFASRHPYDGFKQEAEKLSDIGTFRQLTARASQCGFAVHRVAFHGYLASPALQRLQEEAIEARTRLALERERAEQEQALLDLAHAREKARVEPV